MLADADGPVASKSSELIHRDWAQTAHAQAGVNCSGCHRVGMDQSDSPASKWSDWVTMDTCGKCHEKQVETFSTGKHGMRLAAGLSPMRPEMARLPMHGDAAHRELTCNACHSGHRFDTQFAAADACLQCHADDHSMAYMSSSHAELWQQEVAGDAEPGTGVSCASCHLPRLSDGEVVWVSHDQNANLRPNETMAREVCGSCHGLEFSLSALADRQLVASCFQAKPIPRFTLRASRMAKGLVQRSRRKTCNAFAKRRSKP